MIRSPYNASGGSGPASRKIEDGGGEFIPGAGPAAGHVIEPVLLAPQQGQDVVGQFRGGSRRHLLIVDDADGGAPPGRVQHRLDEIAAFVQAARPAVESARPDDEMAPAEGPDEMLPGQLRLPIGVERDRLIVLRIGSALAAIEDIVGAEMDEHGSEPAAGPGQPAQGEGVDGEGLLDSILRLIHPIEGGGIDDHVGADRPQGRFRGRRPGHIELRIEKRPQRCGRDTRRQVRAQLPIRPDQGDDRRCHSLSSPAATLNRDRKHD